jgi:hypothetical protein
MTLGWIAPDQKPTIEGSLARLEALKAKQAEIEAEVKKEQAVLKQLLAEAHQRANKVGVGMPAPQPMFPLPPGPSMPAPGLPPPGITPGLPPPSAPVPPGTPASPFAIIPTNAPAPSVPPSPPR